ncbi:MAG: rhodanese-like domain-containing protein [Rhizobium leguminosarum]
MPELTSEELVEKTRDARISAENAIRYIEEGAIAIDVRSDQRRAEFGSVPGAHALRKEDVVSFVREKRGDTSRKVVLFCMSERGTAAVLDALRTAGEPEVFDVEGGFRALSASGLATVPYTSS